MAVVTRDCPAVKITGPVKGGSVLTESRDARPCKSGCLFPAFLNYLIAVPSPSISTRTLFHSRAWLNRFRKVWKALRPLSVRFPFTESATLLAIATYCSIGVALLMSLPASRRCLLISSVFLDVAAMLGAASFTSMLACLRFSTVSVNLGLDAPISSAVPLRCSVATLKVSRLATASGAAARTSSAVSLICSAALLSSGPPSPRPSPPPKPPWP